MLNFVPIVENCFKKILKNFMFTKYKKKNIINIQDTNRCSILIRTNKEMFYKKRGGLNLYDRRKYYKKKG